jgi:phage tail tape-measure protein
MGNLKTSIIIDLINRVSGPARKIKESLLGIGVTNKQLGAVSVASSRIGSDLAVVGSEVASLTAKLALLGGAGLWFVKTQLIDTAAQFERFSAILKTVEGSSGKAKIAMDWVSDFATRTPYELAEVMESFVRLRAYGLDPTNGLLLTLGDTASAMGKPLMQAVEAIADAMTGENERLKEFGIRAEAKGNKMRYTYTDAAGKQQYKIVDKNNRAMIQSTLMAIWNEKYRGAMSEQSKTWEGMVSNLSDQWTRFKVKVMQAGLFDWMKGKLSNLLATVDRMAANGSLQKLATDFGVKLKNGFVAAWQVGSVLWRVLQAVAGVVAKLANAMGGYENLVMAVAGLMAGKLVLSIVSVAAGFVGLGKAALPVAATALKNFIPLMVQAQAASLGLLAVLGKIGLLATAGAGGYVIGSGINKLLGAGMDKLTGGKYKGEGAIGEWLYDYFHPQQTPATNKRSGLQAAPQAAPAPSLAIPPPQKAQASGMSGELKMEIITPPGTRAVIRDMRSHNLDLDVDSGQMMRSH